MAQEWPSQATRPTDPADATPPGLDDLPEGAEEAAEPYLQRPGVYVIPQPYAPDNWSPRIRRFPDYNPDAGSRLDTSRLRRFGGRSHWGGFYGAPRRYTDPGYGYYYSPYSHDLETAYNQGRYDADHEYLWYIASQRAGRLLNQYSDQFDEALLAFHNGRYDRSLIGLLGAAEKNHGSAAARLHAGHALFALGKYNEGIRLIARAFELSPSLTYKDYDIRDEYGLKDDFGRHLAALRAHVDANPQSASGQAMLGYVLFYTDGPSAAAPSLERAYRLSPRSYFIPKLLKVARMTAGAETAGSPRAEDGRRLQQPLAAPARESRGVRPRPEGAPEEKAPAQRRRNIHRVVYTEVP